MCLLCLVSHSSTNFLQMQLQIILPAVDVTCLKVMGMVSCPAAIVTGYIAIPVLLLSCSHCMSQSAQQILHTQGVAGFAVELT